VIISSDGLALIKLFEGFRPMPYLDVAGFPTIGVGHLIRQGEDFTQGITEAQAEDLLRKDVETSERAVVRLTPRQLDQSQFDALVSFTFNLGVGAYQRSTLRQCVIAGHDDLVPDQFLRWTRAGGMVRLGLVRRRKAEAALYMREEDYAQAA
jgi:lysozyme